MSTYSSIVLHKPERFSEVSTVVGRFSEAPQGEASEEDLFKEFSELLDKIASQLSPDGVLDRTRNIPAEVLGLTTAVTIGRKEVKERPLPYESHAARVGSSKESANQEHSDDKDSLPSNGTNGNANGVSSGSSDSRPVASSSSSENASPSTDHAKTDHAKTDHADTDHAGDSKLSESAQVSEEAAEPHEVIASTSAALSSEAKLPSGGAKEATAAGNQNSSATIDQLTKALDAGSLGEGEAVVPEVSQQLSLPTGQMSPTGLEKDYASLTALGSRKGAQAFGAQIAATFQEMGSREALVTSLLVKQAFEMVHEKLSDAKTTVLSQAPQTVNAVATRSTLRQESVPLTKRDPLQFVRPPSLETLEKVESALREAVKARDGKTITVRIDPANLGTVKVDVTLRERELHARVVTESQMVASWLRERTHEIQQALRKIGLNVDNITVSVASGDTAVELDLAKGHSPSFNTNGDFQQKDVADENGNSRKTKTERESRTLASSAVMVSYDGLDHWIA